MIGLSKEDLANLLEEIGRTHMPFGKYGPKQLPPFGAPIYDLPPEYLMWFAAKGFPKGRLGELMKIVYQAKVDGADCIFQKLREKAGGRHPLRKARQREWDFGDDG